MEIKEIRINKYLSEAGVCSRREADRLVEKGKVFIDGKLAETGAKVGPGQVVVVDGKEVRPVEKEVVRLRLLFLWWS